VGDVKTVLAVTGTQREGMLAMGQDAQVLAGGGDGPTLAMDLAHRAPQACGIISFGTCGGLVPGLAIGDMVIGERVVGAVTATCDPAWTQALSRALPQARRGAVFADGTLLATVAQKRAAAAQGAIIADMESHLVAQTAPMHRLPFAILRCISDTAEAALPPAVAVAMRPGGSLALGKVLASILRHPGQLPALIRTGLGFNLALTALDLGACAAGRRFSFDQR
jgi:hypothetical protein